jgi:hypothetical protein
MKKVIDGKRYDTDTAEHLCSLPSVEDTTNFNWHATSLYQTKKGTFFIAGEGNASSIWASSEGNGWGAGSGIRVTSPVDARMHLELAGCEESVFFGCGLSVEEG